MNLVIAEEIKSLSRTAKEIYDEIDEKKTHLAKYRYQRYISFSRLQKFCQDNIENETLGGLAFILKEIEPQEEQRTLSERQESTKGDGKSE